MENIRDICASRLLDPKWLIAPSLRTGTSWIESVVRGGTACVNLTPATVRRFALEIAGPELSRQGLTVLDEAASPLIMDWAWHRLDGGYFSQLKKSSGLLSSVSRTIEELRLQGISADMLCSGSSNPNGSAAPGIPPAKAADLSVLQEAWTEYLSQHRIVDQADVLKLALAAVENGALSASTLVLTPEDLTFHGLERRLMEAIPKEQRVTITPPLREEHAEESSTPGSSVSVPPIMNFARAVGEAHELREVLRRCVAAKLPLDEIEILHTDSATYGPIAYELASTIKTTGSKSLPVTFADGLPVTMSRPIRALRSWLRWIESDYSQPLLVEMFAEGLLDCGDFAPSTMAKLLRPLAIRLGSSHYIPKLDEQIEATRDRIASAEDDDPDALAQRISHLEKKRKQLRVLKKKVEALLKMADDISSGNSDVALAVVATFLTKAARSITKFDHVSVAIFNEKVADRKQWISTLGLNVNVVDFVSMLIEQVQVMDNGPQPGCVHVAPLHIGGQSGRKYAFVIGMDDRRFPGAFMQDPILLDHERRSLANDFPDSSTRLHEKLEDIRARLSHLKGEITFLWSCRSLRDDTEMFPASLVLDMYRVATGNFNADMDALTRSAGQPISFSPTRREMAITPGEHWLWQLTEPGFDRTDQTAFVGDLFPHLRQGTTAVVDRFRNFGSWSGHVPEAKEHVKPFADDGVIYSASALEKLGTCPLSFFFQRRLGLYPPDEPLDDLDMWLDARHFGSLLHELFRRFMAQLSARDERPVYADHYPRLLELLRELITEYKNLMPPPNDSALRRDSGRLVVIARTFLREEEVNCRKLQPRFFEAALGMEQIDSATRLDTDHPVSVDLGNGLTIRARGQIDRIDEIRDLVFSICDYKTGSAYGYDQNKPFRSGRRIQNILYVRMVEQVLREKVDSKSRVAQFEYFFPGTKASGLRRTWPVEQLNDGLNVLTQLTSMDAAGVYPPTNDSNDCRFCDFQNACGNYERLARSSKSWLENNASEALADFQELRNE